MVGAAAPARTPVTTGVCPLPALPASPPQDALQVTAFGAAPDDDRADDEPVRQALEALRPGQWLVFAPGRYRFEHRIEVHTPGVTLWGRGAELLALDPADQTLGVRADGVRIVGFTLQARTDTRRTNVESARLTALPDDRRRTRLHGVVLRDNHIGSGSSAGIFVAAVEGFTVAGNEVSGTLADGIHVTGGAVDGRVSGNRVHGVGDDGIAIVSYEGDAQGPVQRMRIEDNDVEDLPWGRGLSVVGGQDVVLQANRVARVRRAAGVLVAREDGWHTHGVQRVQVLDNRLREIQPAGAVTGHAAIEVHALGRQGQVSDVLIQGNRIERVSTDGVRLGADTRPDALHRIEVRDNRVEQAAGEALAVLQPGAQGQVAARPALPPCAQLP